MGYVTAELHGQMYRLQCEDGEEGRLRNLLEYVSEKLDQVKESDNDMENDHALVLASLLVTDELFTLHARLVANESDG